MMSAITDTQRSLPIDKNISKYIKIYQNIKIYQMYQNITKYLLNILKYIQNTYKIYPARSGPGCADASAHLFWWHGGARAGSHALP